MRWMAVAFAALLFWSAPARADDDGHYCAGPDYLAFELRRFKDPLPRTRHLLRIVRFGTTRHMDLARDVMLDDFQVHPMTCDAREVRVAGWGEHGYVAYRVRVDETLPRVVERASEGIEIDARRDVRHRMHVA